MLSTLLLPTFHLVSSFKVILATRIIHHPILQDLDSSFLHCIYNNIDFYQLLALVASMPSNQALPMGFGILYNVLKAC